MSSELHSAKIKPGCSRFIPALFAVVLVAAPIAFYSCGTEINKWRIAAATEQLYNEGYDAAISSISQSLEADPDSPDLLFQRSKWYEKTAQYQLALHDVDRSIESARTSGWDSQALAVLEWHRAEILIDLQRYDDAEKSLSQIAEYNSKWLSEDQQGVWKPSERINAAMIRNNFAYFCSRADRKIEDAAKYIDWAVKDYDSLEQNYQRCAVVYAELRQDEAAAQMFSKVIEIADSKFKLAQRQLLIRASASVAYGVPPKGDHASQILSMLNDYQSEVSTLRSALLARAQMYERLKLSGKADADRKSAAQLGEAPAAKSRPKLTLDDIVQYLSTSAAYIDTRGCVRFRQGQYAEALQDFNYALDIQRLQDVWSRQNHGRPFELIDPRGFSFALKEYHHGKATLLYHRALTKKRLNDLQGAELDEREIRQLGFEPGPNLF